MSESRSNLLMPFVDGLRVVLGTMCDSEIQAGKPFVKGTVETPNIDIASYISLAGTKLTGAIVLKFPEKTYLGLVSKMLGENFDQINSEISDGAGEIINQIYGHGKTILNQQGFDLERSLPKVLLGQNINVSIYSSSPVIVMPIQTPSGELFMEFYLG